MWIINTKPNHLLPMNCSESTGLQNKDHLGEADMLSTVDTYTALVHLGGTGGPLNKGKEAHIQLSRLLGILYYVNLLLHVTLSWEAGVVFQIKGRRDVRRKGEKEARR